MPLTQVGLTGTLAGALASTGHVGPSVPQLATGVASGVVTFITSSLKAVTVDTGTVGNGNGALPLLVPTPLLIGSLTGGFTAQAIMGAFAPQTILGLSNGLTTGLAQGVITTIHPSVGTGSGVVHLVGASAVPSMIAGFASAGLTGPASVRLATAVGLGHDTTFAAFVTVTPIVGGAGPAPSSGAGFGTVV